jgi:tetratricopeptide (TPR) repeat protein
LFIEPRDFAGKSCEWEGRLEDAWAIYRELLSLNPNDNQGVRALAVTVLLALKRPDEVVKVCAAYAEDVMPETAYGRALALFQLGSNTDATRALREAIQWLPLVAKELLKLRHRRPKSAMPGFITMGGADEAYNYWQRDGRFWRETEGALSWLAEIAHTIPRRKGRKRD